MNNIPYKSTILISGDDLHVNSFNLLPANNEPSLPAELWWKAAVNLGPKQTTGVMYLSTGLDTRHVSNMAPFPFLEPCPKTLRCCRDFCDICARASSGNEF